MNELLPAMKPGDFSVMVENGNKWMNGRYEFIVCEDINAQNCVTNLERGLCDTPHHMGSCDARPCIIFLKSEQWSEKQKK